MTTTLELEAELDIHDGRPMRPEYRERGETLMLIWNLDDETLRLTLLT